MRSSRRAFTVVGTLLLAAIIGGLVLRRTSSSGGDDRFGPADRPAPRTDENSLIAHAELLEKAKQGRIDVYFVGDSIVRRWDANDYPELLENWTRNFYGWNASLKSNASTPISRPSPMGSGSVTSTSTTGWPTHRGDCSTACCTMASIPR